MTRHDLFQVYMDRTLRASMSTCSFQIGPDIVRAHVGFRFEQLHRIFPAVLFVFAHGLSCLIVPQFQKLTTLDNCRVFPYLLRVCSSAEASQQEGDPGWDISHDRVASLYRIQTFDFAGIQGYMSGGRG